LLKRLSEKNTKFFNFDRQSQSAFQNKKGWKEYKAQTRNFSLNTQFHIGCIVTKLFLFIRLMPGVFTDFPEAVDNNMKEKMRTSSIPH